MSLGALLREWRFRLAGLYRRAADAVPSQEWLVAIRIRILSYFIRRYGEGSEDRAEPDPRPARPARTFCIVDDPIDHPPRPTAHLRPLLEDIRRLNMPSAPAWRRWLPRLLLHRSGDPPAA